MEIKLNQELTFGKYKGLTIEKLLDAHIRVVKSRLKYLNWIQAKTECTLSKEVLLHIQNVKEYYAIGCGGLNQDHRSRSDLYCVDNIDGDNPYSFVNP